MPIWCVRWRPSDATRWADGLRPFVSRRLGRGPHGSGRGVPAPACHAVDALAVHRPAGQAVRRHCPRTIVGRPDGGRGAEHGGQAARVRRRDGRCRACRGRSCISATTAVYLVVQSWAKDFQSRLSIFRGMEVDDLRPAPIGAGACVWEQEVLSHERASYVNHILNAEVDVDSWLDDCLDTRPGRRSPMGYLAAEDVVDQLARGLLLGAYDLDRVVQRGGHRHHRAVLSVRADRRSGAVADLVAAGDPHCACTRQRPGEDAQPVAAPGQNSAW